MKNIFKIIFILCLGMFVVTGCADDSSGNGGGNNGGDNDTPEFTKLISAEVLSYGETADGKRYVWGKEAGRLVGQLGFRETPVEVGFTINKIVDGFTVYVSTDAGLYAWGNNEKGQVGNGTTEYVLSAYKVEGISGTIKELITRGSTVYVLTDIGLFAWGDNRDGQVGNGTTENVTTPYKAVEGNIKEFRVSGFSYTTYTTYYALTADGLYIWGNNRYGQAGNGESGYEKGEDGEVDYSKPKQVLKPYKVKIEKQN